jgi:hypothetical protein
MPGTNDSPRKSTQQTESQFAAGDLIRESLARAETDNEQCARAVSFLLDYCSDFGNETLDGDVAIGLSRVLKDCAREIARTSDLRKRATGEAR